MIGKRLALAALVLACTASAAAHADKMTFTFSNATEERLCYGAWIPRHLGNTVWGAGKTGITPCEKCCLVCKNGSVLKTVTLRLYK